MIFFFLDFKQSEECISFIMCILIVLFLYPKILPERVLRIVEYENFYEIKFYLVGTLQGRSDE